MEYRTAAGAEGHTEGMKKRNGYDPFDYSTSSPLTVTVHEEGREPQRPLLYDASGKPLMTPRPERRVGFREPRKS